MEHAECRDQLAFPDQETLEQILMIEPRILESAAARKFRFHGPSLFIGGFELWCYIQLHWFSGSFRLQALGVVLLIYWILGGLFMTRQPAAEPEDDVMERAE